MGQGGREKTKTTLHLTPETDEWIKAVAGRRGVTVGEVEKVNMLVVGIRQAMPTAREHYKRWEETPLE